MKKFTPEQVEYLFSDDSVGKQKLSGTQTNAYAQMVWNEAIEAAIQVCNAYDRGFSTDAGMIRLKIMELKK